LLPLLLILLLPLLLLLTAAIADCCYCCHAATAADVAFLATVGRSNVIVMMGGEVCGELDIFSSHLVHRFPSVAGYTSLIVSCPILSVG